MKIDVKKTENNKSQNFIIPLVVYPFGVMVSIRESNKELEERFKTFDVAYKDYFKQDFKAGKCTLFDSGQTVIRFIGYPDSGLIAHEVFHCVTCLLDHIGMPFNIDHNDEAHAYLIGYLTNEIYKNLDKCFFI